MSFRAVLDTNVVLAAKRSTSTTSPNAEVVSRWRAAEFTWLLTHDILNEYADKLLELGIAATDVVDLLVDLGALGELVPIHFFHVRNYPSDADDTPFLLAALNGQASHLVTYDEHLQLVGIFYPEFKTCEPIEFLSDLRKEPQH
ncbi:MAG: putative toxin-antitoxin system toxin component, PIN family [Verrucomicrobiaceae bacterium]|nr:putative toxin-antitoxin system toxin component, PIN family [Verrucomicrobiaceae bacterium]